MGDERMNVTEIRSVIRDFCYGLAMLGIVLAIIGIVASIWQ